MNLVSRFQMPQPFTDEGSSIKIVSVGKYKKLNKDVNFVCSSTAMIKGEKSVFTISIFLNLVWE